MKDLIIIGAGPAGLTAGIYVRRAGKTVTVIEKNRVAGGVLPTTPEIENFPGFGKIDGFTLAQKFKEHATSLGVELVCDEISKLYFTENIATSHGKANTYTAKNIILASGTRRRKLEIPGEEKFIGRGVSYCAVCDGNFFRGKDVCVVGGGNTALEDAIYLSGLGCNVTLIHRRNEFRADKKLQDSLSGIKIITNATPIEILGNKFVEKVVLSNGEQLPTKGLFVCIGSVAQSELLDGLIPLLPDGRVEAGEDCKTQIPNLFVAGDLRQKNLYQIATAVADGANAANSIK